MFPSKCLGGVVSSENEGERRWLVLTLLSPDRLQTTKASHLGLKPFPQTPLLKATSSVCPLRLNREGERGAASPRLQDHDPVD